MWWIGRSCKARIMKAYLHRYCISGRRTEQPALFPTRIPQKSPKLPTRFSSHVTSQLRHFKLIFLLGWVRRQKAVTSVLSAPFSASEEPSPSHTRSALLRLSQMHTHARSPNHFSLPSPPLLPFPLHHPPLPPLAYNIAKKWRNTQTQSASSAAPPPGPSPSTWRLRLRLVMLSPSTITA